jgi:hypothetical protein
VGVCGSTVVKVTGAFSMTGTKTFSGQLRAVDGWNRALAGRNTWANTDGRLGYQSSSRRFKQNIQDADVAPEKVLGLRVVDFEYKESPDHVETGLIAEEVEETGLEFLVDRDFEGNPYSVYYDKVGLAALSLAKEQQHQINKMYEDVDQLRNKILK